MRHDRSELVAARKGKGLKQEDLAELLHLDQSTVSRIERGHTMPDADVAKTLMETLGVTIDVVVGQPVADQQTDRAA